MAALAGQLRAIIETTVNARNEAESAKATDDACRQSEDYQRVCSGPDELRQPSHHLTQVNDIRGRIYTLIRSRSSGTLNFRTAVQNSTQAEST
jgi:hypothetical protein